MSFITENPKLIPILFVFATQTIALQARADVCTDAWSTASASQSCEVISYSGIAVQAPLNNGDPEPLCSFTIRCRTTNTIAEDPGKFQSQQITEWNTTSGKLPPSQLKLLNNCRGTLSGSPC